MCIIKTTIKVLLGLVLILPFSSVLHAEEKPIPRVLIGLYDSRVESNPRLTVIYRYLALPANHLGYDLNVYDVTSPLPTIGDNVAGIVLWFDDGTKVPDLYAYLKWLKSAMQQNKKILVIGNPGFESSQVREPQLKKMWNDILAYIGVQGDLDTDQLLYNAEIAYIDRTMVDFEREIKKPFPEISGYRVLVGSHSASHLRIHVNKTINDDNFDMVITGPHGGLVAPGYDIFERAKQVTFQVETAADRKEREVKKFQVTQEWIVNPFTFLKTALDNEQFPIPDTTTLDGRRIFYSQIDGDGWNNISEIGKYRDNNIIAAEVIYREILQPYTDFAFTVGLISEDIDPQCFGVPDSEKVAREIFALPDVEPSSHSYSHPLYWQFFKDYTPEKEYPYLKYYPLRPKEKTSAVDIFEKWASNKNFLSKPTPPEATKNDSTNNNPHRSEQEILKEDFSNMPRSYACTPFKLEQEIYTAIDIVKKLSPPDKTVRLLQWPGNTSPFEEAIAMSRKAGLLNLNGGDSRFDGEFPSYSFVAPIGLKVGHERQIFSSNSNEETYTDNWTDRFYGYIYLKNTVIKTDNPIRVNPFNVYFHMFSGQKEASLNAVKNNLDFARTQDIIPITASDYASIADGFFSSEIIPDGENRWHIRNRGDLSTVRFDEAQNLSINFDKSHGVMGQSWYNGSLYVALDPAIKDATVSVYKGRGEYAQIPDLVQSRWQIRNLKHINDAVEFEAYGYGSSDMIWQGMPDTEYQITMLSKGNSSSITVHSNSKGLIPIAIKSRHIATPMHIIIRHKHELLPERLNVPVSEHPPKAG